MSKLNGLLFFCSLSAIITSAVLTVTPYCEVPEHKLRLIYNLTKLSSDKEDVIIEHEHETIRMQLCSPLIKKCNNQDGYAICLIKNNVEKGIGRHPPVLDNSQGRILFNFTGDSCPFGTNYTVTVIMLCDYDSENNSYPELFAHGDKQCNLYIVWRTVLACLPKVQTNCTVANGGHYYDLSPLTRTSENYVILVKNDTKSRIVLNVCHNVIHHGAMCPLNSGACLDNPESINRYSSLGDVQKPPFFSNGNLLIEYENGGLCTQNIPAQHIKTTITFKCNLEATGPPEYIGGKEDCHYQLIWYTPAACDIKTLLTYSAKTAGKCIVRNPVTNFTYTLQTLMYKDFTVTNLNGTEYKFRVCSELTDNTCEDKKTGICKQGTVLGQASTNLIWQQGGPYLNYTNGDLCENGMRHYTLIRFFCEPQGSPSRPLLIKENSCQTIIHWNTDLVCEKKIKCAIDNNDEINLTPLIKSTNNYVIKANDTEFHINICRPLVSTQGLTCAHGSAACKVSLTSKNEYTNEVSLGFPEDSPTLNKDFLTVLRYTNGSQCPENPAKTISSNFTFICNNNNQGLPVYKHYINCTYVFEWNTSIACGAVIGSWSAPCIIRDNFLSYEYDFSLLYKKKQIYYVKSKQGTEYALNICGGEKYCSGSAVCHEDNGYGSLRSVIFDYSRDDVKLKYSNGSKCNNSSYTSEIRFICNESMGIGAPKMLLESQCSAEFEWHTEVICAKHASSRNASQENASSSRILEQFSSSHAGVVAGVVLTVIAVLAALIYFRNPVERACCRPWTNLFNRRGTGRVQYCRVDTTEEARLLLDASDPTQCQSDSDDDLLNA